MGQISGNIETTLNDLKNHMWRQPVGQELRAKIYHEELHREGGNQDRNGYKQLIQGLTELNQVI